MLLHELGKRSESVPLLAGLRSAQKLYDVAKDKSPLARKQLMQVVGAILQIKVTNRESELVADILIDLLQQAEKDLRQALSRQLSSLENVPLRLVLQLANDEIDVAKPILTDSPVLGGFDLVYIIKSKTSQYWQAIAERKILDNQVIDILADTGDFETALVLAKNSNIKLTQHALLLLSDLAQDSEVLSTPLLRREDISPDIVQRLYAFVGKEMKDHIVQKYKLDQNIISHEVDKVVQKFIDESQSKSAFLPEDYMLKDAQVIYDKGLLDIPTMLETLRSGHMRTFVAQFSVYLELPMQVIESIVLQSTGQKLALACKAFDISKSDFVSLFLLTSKIRDGGRMVEMDDITRAINFYNNAESSRALESIRSLVKH